MPRVEIRSLRTPTRITGIPDHPAAIELPAGLSVVFEAFSGKRPSASRGPVNPSNQSGPGTGTTSSGGGQIVSPNEEKGKPILVPLKALARVSAKQLLKSDLIESRRVRIAVHDIDRLDVRELQPVAERADEAGLDVVIEVGTPHG